MGAGSIIDIGMDKGINKLSSSCIYFCKNTLGKGMNLSLFLIYGLNSRDY